MPASASAPTMSAPGQSSAVSGGHGYVAATHMSAYGSSSASPNVPPVMPRFRPIMPALPASPPLPHTTNPPPGTMPRYANEAYPHLIQGSGEPPEEYRRAYSNDHDGDGYYGPEVAEGGPTSSGPSTGYPRYGDYPGYRDPESSGEYYRG
uniref:Uncharacterized protein n=1 Tax=Mycena chlorophos TaxID=658473 RepID=A0ABQ0KYH2_MYCCL|nr:predicted protein [Mycena chlorophos]